MNEDYQFDGLSTNSDLDEGIFIYCKGKSNGNQLVIHLTHNEGLAILSHLKTIYE